MKIIVLDYNTMHLLLEFTEDELKHPLFSSTLSRMRNNDGFEVHKSSKLVSVQVIDFDSVETIGMAVDDIRELWMGDVVFDYESVEISPVILDDDGNIVSEAVTEIQRKVKDLSKCPCFTFTPEPVMEELDDIEPTSEDNGLDTGSVESGEVQRDVDSLDV